MGLKPQSFMQYLHGRTCYLNIQNDDVSWNEGHCVTEHCGRILEQNRIGVSSVKVMIRFVQVNNVLGLKNFQKQGIYDITFCTSKLCQRFYLELKTMKEIKYMAILDKM